MFGRPDPFFTTEAPHKRNFLESLQRQYGKQTYGLPARDNPAFKRAMQFRESEKLHYAALQRDNDMLRGRLSEVEAAHNSLRAETDQIRKLWEQLSKPESKDESERPCTTDDTQRVRTGESDPSDESGRVVQRTEDRDDSGGGAAVPGDAPAEGTAGSGDADGVRREVLPAKSVRNPRRPAAEHTAEGPEPGSGAESAEGESDSGGGVSQDKE